MSQYTTPYHALLPCLFLVAVSCHVAEARAGRHVPGTSSSLMCNIYPLSLTPWRHASTRNVHLTQQQMQTYMQDAQRVQHAFVQHHSIFATKTTSSSRITRPRWRRERQGQLKLASHHFDVCTFFANVCEVVGHDPEDVVGVAATQGYAASCLCHKTRQRTGHAPYK